MAEDCVLERLRGRQARGRGKENSTEKFCEAVHAGRKLSYLKGRRLAFTYEVRLE
jgi:hypothetical protein